MGSADKDSLTLARTRERQVREQLQPFAHDLGLHQGLHLQQPPRDPRRQAFVAATGRRDQRAHAQRVEEQPLPVDGLVIEVVGAGEGTRTCN